ncbi:MAG: preprotein translocase subunit SecY [Elusimicrobia bacterium]|nr:preprotein translocase subunit SecY [Elusimicrobiota bacterium]
MEQIFNLFKIPEVRRRLLFTLGVLALYRVGAAIPLPGINTEALRQLFEQHRGSFLGFLDIFSGGALSRFSILTLGTIPYINSSIILSLLQGAHVIPYLDRLSREGESGRKRIQQLTRYLAVALAMFQSFAIALGFTQTQAGVAPIIQDPTAGFYMMTAFTWTAGAILVMWLGEQITEFGIGNGISLIIFTGIVARMPASVFDVIRLVRVEEISLFVALVLAALVLVVCGGVVWVETAQRQIPVQYAKRLVGRRMMGGANTYLPIKLDPSGVVAVIFASAVIQAPLFVSQLFPNSAWAQLLQKVFGGFGGKSPLFSLIYAGLIIFFCYFYNSIAINPQDLAENMKKWGGFIPGIRPGKSTADFIEWVVEHLTLFGALFVASLAVLPDYMRSYLSAPFFFGSTSLLIVVGVALDTMGQLEAHLYMRHYEGFLKKGRIRGRWFNVGQTT